MSTWSPVEVTPSVIAEEAINSANSSVSNTTDATDDDGENVVQQLASGNTTTSTVQPQQSGPTAGKTKRDDGPAKAADNPLPSPPLPEPQRAAAPPHRDSRDVIFTAAVQHHVTAFVTWNDPTVSACDSDGLTSDAAAVVGYRLRYGNRATSTSFAMNLSSNVAAIDGLMPSAEYWYQIQHLFDDGTHSPWTDKHLFET